MNADLTIRSQPVTAGMDLNSKLSTTTTSAMSVQDPLNKSAPAQEPALESIGTTKELKRAEARGLKVGIGDKQLIKEIDRAIKALEGHSTTLQYSVHEKTHQIMVKVLDKDTGQVIREVPPKKILDLVASMMERAGIIVDERG